MGVLSLLPVPFLLFFNQSDVALRFGIVAFVVWGAAAAGRFIRLLFMSKHYNSSIQSNALFETFFEKYLSYFFLFFTVLLISFVGIMRMLDSDIGDVSIYDKRIVIKISLIFLVTVQIWRIELKQLDFRMCIFRHSIMLNKIGFVRIL